MTIESELARVGLPQIFSPEYGRFVATWDAVRVESPGNRWYWSGKQQDWRWLDEKNFAVTDVGLEVIDDTRQHTALWVFSSVETAWGRICQQHPDAVWNPRSGAWLASRELGGTPSPSPAPPSPPPDLWIQRMNEELAGIDKLNLTPAERESARAAVRKRYLGG
jgi:hypothetical protein